MKVKRFSNKQEMSEAAAELVLAAALDSVELRGVFTMALTGGATPDGLYGLLAEQPYAAEMPWEKCHFFWGDDRAVPPDHDESNYKLARDGFLSKIDIPKANIHRIPAEMEPIEAAADAYESDLLSFFKKKQSDPFPGFDLVLLGVGRDGHIASLFPGSPALEESRRWVLPVPAPEHIGPHLPRLTLTMPVIEASRYVLIMTGTKGKEEMLDRVLALHGAARHYPVFWVQPQGRMSWYIYE